MPQYTNIDWRETEFTYKSDHHGERYKSLYIDSGLLLCCGKYRYATRNTAIDVILDSGVKSLDTLGKGVVYGPNDCPKRLSQLPVK
jgi:hypothetical protein